MLLGRADRLRSLTEDELRSLSLRDFTRGR
jgi:hypothetical protein